MNRWAMLALLLAATSSPEVVIEERKPAREPTLYWDARLARWRRYDRK